VWKFQGIRSQLLVLVAAAVVPFLFLIGAALWNQSRIQQAAALQRALSEAKLLAAQVDDHLGSLENLLTGLSLAVSTDPRDVAANDALLRRIGNEMPDYISAIAVVGLDGENIGSSNGRRFSVRDRGYFGPVLAGERFAVGNPVISRVYGTWILPVARPIRDESGQLRAVLLTATFVRGFQDVLRVNQLPPESLVRIISDGGIVIGSIPDAPDWTGRDLSGVQPVARHIQQKEASEVVTWLDGVPRITATSAARRAPWIVTVALPMEVASAAIISKLLVSGLFSTATIALASLIAWMLSGRIIRPLRQLEKDAEILAAGDYGHRTPIGPWDEVGKLAQAFNQMATSLQRRRNEVLESADKMREAKDTLDAVIDASPAAIVCSDPNRKIMLWNRAAEQTYGYTEAEVIGCEVKTVPPEEVDAARAFYLRASNGETMRSFEARRLRKDGTYIDVCLSAAPMFGPDGKVRGVAYVHEDVTARKKAEAQLKHFAHFDQLTGLANRRTMEEKLTSLVAAEGGGAPTTIALLDLDGFKDVNDTLGHSTGDRLLMEVAGRLKAAAETSNPDALVSRLGGDEFVAILPRCGDPLVIGEVVGEMLARLSMPYEIGGKVLHLGASAGLAIAPQHGTSVDDLLSNADLALYRAKKDGGRTYRFFASTLRAQAQSRRGLDADLRRALSEKEFELYYQPQVRLADGAVTGAEALLRWRHRERGILNPGLFINALTESQIAPEVGKWILETACLQAAEWRAMGLMLPTIAVNLFPTQLHNLSLFDDVENALRRSGLPAEGLELEITENIALNHEEAAKPLRRLRERGVKIAFDDFGTGYASLSCLTVFPVSRIKIDRSFVTEITKSRQDAAIVRSLITMAKSLQLDVIAEGVETTAQAAFLHGERCEEAQGFLYGKPISSAEFGSFLSTARMAGSGPMPKPRSRGRAGGHRR